MSKFVLVKVVGGRKFRGFAYDFGAPVSITNGGRGYASWTSKNKKLWNPEIGMVFCNPNFIEVVENPDTAKVEADRANFSKSIIANTIAWCRSKSEGKPEVEILRFARNVLAKNNPDFVGEFDTLHPEVNEFALAPKSTKDEIISTIKWAMTLRTKEGYYNGHYCRGGFPYRPETIIRIVEKSMTTRGIASRPDFADCLAEALTETGLR